MSEDGLISFELNSEDTATLADIPGAERSLSLKAQAIIKAHLRRLRRKAARYSRAQQLSGRVSS